MSSFIRESKYRNSLVSVNKREKFYENLKIYQSTNDINNICGNSKYLSYIDTTASGANLGVLSLSSVGKNHVPLLSSTYTQPIIKAHSQAIQDFQFHRFDTSKLFTCSLDKTIKLWQIPEEGLIEDLRSPLISLSLSDNLPVKSLSMHTCCNEIVAGRSARTISIFDITTEQSHITSSNTAHSYDILSMDWSFSGDMLLTTCKDKYLRLFDVRCNFEQPIASVLIHSGIRFSRAISLGESPYLLTCGHDNATQTREMFLWDHRNLSKSTYLQKVKIDTGYGSLIPIYDIDHGLLVIIGKGDVSLRLYEVDHKLTSSSSSSSSFEGTAAAAVDNNVIHSISNTSIASMNGNDITKGACLLPKQVNDYKACEIIRMLKLTDNMIQPISITVPRIEQYNKVHEDLFPDTINEAKPSMNAIEWIEGANIPLERVKLDLIIKRDITNSSISNNKDISDSPIIIEDTEKNEVVNTKSNDITNETEISETSQQIRVKRLSNFTSTIKYRHMYGTESLKEFSFYNLQPELSASDNPIIASNDLYFAIPYRGGGGPVFISKLTNYGKINIDITQTLADPNNASAIASSNMIMNDHKATVQDISFSKFHNDILATGSNDCTVKIWNLEQAKDQIDSTLFCNTMPGIKPVLTFNKHKNSIRSVLFHPTIPSLLCTTSQDMSLRHVDIESSSGAMEVNCIELTSEQQQQQGMSLAIPINVDYNYDGTLLSLASKDRVIRVIDPRLGRIVCSTPYQSSSSSSSSSNNNKASNYLGRNLRVCWCATRTSVCADPIVSVSSDHNGLRQIHVWDIRKFTIPLLTKPIDNASGQLFMMFDDSMNTIFLAGKGDTIVRTYEMMFLDETTTEQSINNASSTNGSSNNMNKKYITQPKGIEKSTEFQSSIDPIAGMCMLSKRCCDIRNVEMTILLKLTTDAVIPISYKVPRAEHLKEYFHDDLYQPIKSKQSNGVTIQDWLQSSITCSYYSNTSNNNSNNRDDDNLYLQPILESLQPIDMIPISSNTSIKANTPSLIASKVNSFKLEIKQKEEATIIREDKFYKLQQLAIQNAQYNQNKSGGIMTYNNTNPMKDNNEEEVDSDDNWDD